MYSVVLATMLTTGGAAPAWGGMACHGGCHGGIGLHGGLACLGGFGCLGAYSCHGCHGAYGSAYHVIPVRTAPIGGVSFGSCQGCFGSCFGCYGASYPYFGSAVWGANYTNYVPVQEAAPATEIRIEEKKKTDARPAGMKDAVARITVELPEDAKLTVDGVACPLTSGMRILETPELQPGQKYTYTLEAKVVRNGETIAASRRVVFESGKMISVDFRRLGLVQSVQR